jgi:colanic acid/amylovoran biosynthesis glycosyltransferase
MKIIFFVNSFPNLSETFIINQVTGMIDRGHDVLVIAREESDTEIVHGDVTKYRLVERTIYYSEDSPLMPGNLIIRYLKVITLFWKYRHSVTYLFRAMNPKLFGINALSLAPLYKIICFLDKNLENYDIIHCHYGTNGNIAAMLKDIGILKGKVSTVFHAYELTRHINSRGTHIYDRLFRVGDIFLPISYRWKLKLEELGCPKEKIIVHRMGVDPNRFAYNDRRNIFNGSIKILTVARLVEKKGIEYAIKAFAAAFRDSNNIEYLIAGDGPLRTELSSLTDSLGVRNHVHLLGWKSQNEIVELMNDAHIFLLPSITGEDGDQEGLPVVLMEAMAQGIPIISTFHSGIPELVSDGVSGFLVPEKDISALSARLLEIVHNHELWSQFGKAGNSIIKKEFDINILNNQLNNIFNKIVGKAD